MPSKIHTPFQTRDLFLSSSLLSIRNTSNYKLKKGQHFFKAKYPWTCFLWCCCVLLVALSCGVLAARFAARFVSCAERRVKNRFRYRPLLVVDNDVLRPLLVRVALPRWESCRIPKFPKREWLLRSDNTKLTTRPFLLRIPRQIETLGHCRLVILHRLPALY